MNKMKPAVFLDRDGTINIDKKYLYKIEEFEYIDGVIEALKLFQSKGYMLVIITNQSGIARGYYSETDLIELNKWMENDLKNRGINISGIYYCPHHPNGCVIEYTMKCRCRKPGTALYWRAKHELNIDMKNSIAIGDKKRDLCICEETGMKGYIVGEYSLMDIAKFVDSVGLKVDMSCL